jgi:retron-type reverse transcriptase
MKRLGNLWPRLVAFDNLWLAWRKARKGKSRSGAAQLFELDLEGNLLTLQRELEEGSYRPGEYRLFTIYEHKPRQIAAAPFRDRVVHHAVMNLIEPPLDARFIFDSYACRRGKGTHAAVARYQGWARRYPYVLKLDIRQYFPSIDHAILKQRLRARLKDRKLLSLLDRIIDGGLTAAADLPPFPGDDLLTPLERPRGIPIGNLTSQFFANLYLDDFDHWVKETLHCRAYLRYVDDMVLLADDKSRLADWRELIRERLAADRLLLHPRKAHIYHTRRGISLLGYTVFPDFRRLRAENGYRFFRRLRGLACAYGEGRADWARIDSSVQAWIGHARHADTLGLRRKRFGGVTFTRGSGPEVRPCCAGRFVEQRTGQRAFGGPQQEHTR